jgi:hypothetical protein
MVKKLTLRDHLEDRGIDGRKIIKSSWRNLIGEMKREICVLAMNQTLVIQSIVKPI